jgi:hypothetical protein
MQTQCENPVLAATPDSDCSGFGVSPSTVSYTGSIYENDSALTSQPKMTLGTFLPEDQREDRTYSTPGQFPAFFEHVMLPSLGTDKLPIQQPPAFEFMQDIDFALSENDVFGTSFIPDLDKIIDMSAPFCDIDQQSTPDDQESASRRAAAFQRSLWWVIFSLSSLLSFFILCSCLRWYVGFGSQRRISMDLVKTDRSRSVMVKVSH